MTKVRVALVALVGALLFVVACDGIELVGRTSGEQIPQPFPALTP